ncbi:MAG: 50S ribosomal protein L9 [Deltaproteobacteria bacterium]|nr:50S ribosomal protein L9 [Deltaproteobacteria bacterium]
MIVILKNEVDNLGLFGAEVKVADGYARNYLIPKGLAVPATPGNLKQFEAEKEAFMKKAALKIAKAEQVKTGLQGVTLNFARKAADDDRLFGSVTAHDIEEALKEKGFSVEKKDILLGEPIKHLGQSTVTVKVHSKVTADITVEVVKE